MPTVVYTHPVFLEHDTGEGHPERADRLREIQRVLEDEAFLFLHRDEAPRCDTALIERLHPEAYVRETLGAVPSEGLRALNPDTVISPASGEAALRAAGAVVAAVESVARGRERNAFCAVRPPGHHAEPGQAMGFCLFNNVAIGARFASEAMGLKRVAVVDFDVHHGNGTQSMLWHAPDMLYASSHQMPLFPGTGAAEERGAHDNIVNVPLAPGGKGDAFRAAWSGTLLPRLRDFNPDILLVSAGFDAHKADPLAQLRVETGDFHWLTRELAAVADSCCGGRLVSVLEGGYDLSALGESVTAHVRALMGN